MSQSILRFRYELGLALFLITSLGLTKWNEQVSLIFLGGLVLILGFPHGAFDVFILKKNSKTFFYFFLKLLLYLGFAGVLFLFWSSYPRIFWPLIFFVSALHFLRIEWSLRSTGIFTPDMALAAIFLVPLFHPQNFSEIMHSLHGEAFADWILSNARSIYGLVVLSSLLRLLFFPNRGRHLIILSLGLSSFYFLPLWYAFFSFFIMLHSARHLELNFQRFRGVGLKKYFLILIPVSIVSLIPAWLIFNQNQEFLARVIILLVCLTGPHWLLDEWVEFKDKLLKLGSESH